MTISARRSALDFVDERDIGIDQLDAGKIRPGEGHAAIDHDPFAPARRAEAVKRGIHADLAETAERDEDEFVGAVHLRYPRRSIRCMRCDRSGRGCGMTRQEHIAGFDRLRLVALAQYQPAAAVDPLEDAQNAGRSQRHADGLAKTERVCEPALTNFRKAGALRPNLQHLRHRVAEARQHIFRRAQRRADRGEIRCRIGQ